MAQKSVLGLGRILPFIAYEGDSGGGGSMALATTGDNAAVSADDLLGLNLQLGGLEAAAQPATSQAQLSTVDGSQVVKIGNESLTLEQLQAQLEEGRRARQTLEQSQTKLEIGQTFENMDPRHRLALLNAAQDLIEGRDPFGGNSQGESTLVVNPLDLPDNARVPVVGWEELSDPERYLYSALSAVREELLFKLQEVTGIVGQMRGYLGQIHTQAQEQQLVASLQTLGVNASLASVKAMREQGIDPAVAMKNPQMLEMMRRAHKPKTATVQNAPPEGGVVNDGKTFNANDPNLTPAEMLRMLDSGMMPEDPKDVERLERLRHGMRASA